MKVRKVLRNLGYEPRKNQNFLKSEEIIDTLIEAAEVEGKTVLEIGAATGSITERLKKRAKKVYAVEEDDILYGHLRQNFTGSNVEVINTEFLEWEIPDGIERCVSNLPFHISSETVEKLGKKQIQSAIIFQKDLAESMVAEPGDSNYDDFTVMTKYYFIPVNLRDISGKNYYPQPKVNTSIVKLYPNRERHGIENEEFFLQIIKGLFINKRKKVRNAFVDARNILDIKKEKAKQIRDQIPNSEERVVNLEIIDLKEICKFLKDEIK